MPTIGMLRFAVDDGRDSGIAMLLAKPPDTDICVNDGDCELMASPTTRHLVCRFSGARSLVEAYDKGSLLAQEGLDVLSMVGRADLITRDAEDEHILWWSAGGRRAIALVSTATSSFKVGPVTVTVQDAKGNVLPPTPVIPKHHMGFRFYRLSQASDDLYDAYRNMYLAFESLLSSKYPKSKGLEIDWLSRSLASASSDLSLQSLVPPGNLDPVEYVIGIIYVGARLPLFHAKDGKAYFAPVQSVTVRETVSGALQMLTHIVLRMADKWYNARRIRGGVNLKFFARQNHTIFEGSHFVFSDNPAFTLHDDLKCETIANDVPFPAKFGEAFGALKRQNIFGEISVSKLYPRRRLHAVYLVNESSPLIGTSPESPVDLTGVDDLQVLLFLRSRNASEPRYTYAR